MNQLFILLLKTIWFMILWWKILNRVILYLFMIFSLTLLFIPYIFWILRNQAGVWNFLHIFALYQILLAMIGKIVLLLNLRLSFDDIHIHKFTVAVRKTNIILFHIIIENIYKMVLFYITAFLILNLELRWLLTITLLFLNFEAYITMFSEFYFLFLLTILVDLHFSSNIWNYFTLILI